jgi:hypothetical protein
MRETWDRRTRKRLREILSDLYPTVESSRRVAVEAGLRTSLVAFQSIAANNWFEILEQARLQGRLEALLDVVLEDHPAIEPLRVAREGGSLSALQGPDVAQQIPWCGPTEPATLEKLTGRESALVPVSFLQIGLERARAVARIRLTSGGMGSGFLIPGNVLVTNHHVLPDAATARGAVAELNVQTTPGGLPASVEVVETAPDELFVTSAADDWTAVRLRGDPVARWGCLEIEEREIRAGDRVNIIQHPEGGPKQLSFFHNVVVHVGDGRVQYLTDTLPGSSGSPVFDRSWKLCALHHSGGWLSDPISTRKELRNQGIHVTALARGLRDAGVLPTR